MEYIQHHKKFFLIGCSECAALCRTGSEESLQEISDFLQSEGKAVTGTLVPKTGCQTLVTKIELKKDKDACDAADAVLFMSCGAGVQ